MKKCEKCGTLKESEFCPNCGGQMIEIEETFSERVEPTVNTDVKETKVTEVKVENGDNRRESMGNVGKNIQSSAIICAIVGGLGSLIIGFQLMGNYYLESFGLPVLFAGLLMTAVTSLVLYGLGQLVEDVHYIRDMSSKKTL